jgi:O-antigen/teichoic acid export membrane protein
VRPEDCTSTERFTLRNDRVTRTVTRDDSGDGDEDFDADIPDDERDALVTVAHGAVVTAGGISVQRALTVAAETLLARSLGPVAYGVYALAWRIAQLAFRFVTFGTVQTLQRYVPSAGDASRGRVAGLAYATTVVVGAAIALGFVLVADPVDAATVTDPSFRPALVRFGAVVLAVGLVKTHAGLLRSVGSARGEVLFNRLLRPAVRLVAAAGAASLGYSVVGVAGALAAGMGVLAVLGLPATVSSTGIRPTLGNARVELRRFFHHATPIALSSIGKIFQNRVDVLLVSALLTATATGVYNVVLVLVTVAWIPLQAFNQLLPPVASELHANGETETLDSVYTAVTRLIVTAVVPVLAVQVVFGRALLSVFGPTYVRGYVPLVVYLGGVLTGSAVGATGWLLTMTDHQYARMALDWLLAAINVTLTYVFVVEFGLPGAALGTSVAIVVQNLTQAFVLRRFEGLWPFDVTFLKPLAAGVAMAGVMFLVRESLAGPLAVGFGLLAGLGVFFGTLLLLGVSDRDRLVVRELVDRYRRRAGAATR